MTGRGQIRECDQCGRDFEARNSAHRYCSQACSSLGQYADRAGELVDVLVSAGERGLSAVELADALALEPMHVGFVVRSARVILGDENGEVIVNRRHRYSIAMNVNEGSAWGMALAQRRRRELQNVIDYLSHVKHHFKHDRRARKQIDAIELSLRAAEAVFATVDFSDAK